MADKKFASHADLEEKKISWEKLSDNAYAYTAEGDPNTGVIIGDDSCMIIDATATPVAAQGVIQKIREITDKPIKYVVLTHYHAVRVLGASGYKAEACSRSSPARTPTTWSSSVASRTWIPRLAAFRACSRPSRACPA
jgi:glyoxylase-like metal-dependent hydrolase (beta-lactamase superfamily II)